jgi:hypothetical protein
VSGHHAPGLAPAFSRESQKPFDGPFVQGSLRQKYPVAVFVMIHDEFVAVRDVALDAGSRHGAEQLLDEAYGHGEGSAANVGALNRLSSRWSL